MSFDFVGLTEQRPRGQPVTRHPSGSPTSSPLMNQQDATVSDVVRRALPAITAGVEAIVAGFAHGGRAYLPGGRHQRPPGGAGRQRVSAHFGTPPGDGSGHYRRVAWMRAGSVLEGAEDDPAGGGAPDCRAQCRTARPGVWHCRPGADSRRDGGHRRSAPARATTLSVVCNRDTPLAEMVDLPIVVEVGPEVLTGSTRLKAGTAQKMVLNMLSTASLARSGRVYGNLISLA